VIPFVCSKLILLHLSTLGTAAFVLLPRAAASFFFRAAVACVLLPALVLFFFYSFFCSLFLCVDFPPSKLARGLCPAR